MTGKYQINYDIKVKVINDSKLISNIDEYTKESIFNSVEKIFSNQNTKGTIDDPVIRVNIIEDPNSTINVYLFDYYDENVGDEKPPLGVTKELGNTISNEIKVSITENGLTRSLNKIARTFAHELGHVAGLKHVWEEDIEDAKQKGPIYNQKFNLMNSGKNPIESQKSISGKKLTQGQRNAIEKNVEKNQKDYIKK
jgi:predicted Zn-dependent protease